MPLGLFSIGKYSVRVAKLSIGLHRAFARCSSNSASISGYECSQYPNIMHEKSLLEKSIRAGCRTVVSLSGISSLQIYELLFDLTADENFHISKLQLGHRFRFPPKSVDVVAARDSWSKELTTIQSILRKKNKELDFATFQVQNLSSYSLRDQLAYIATVAAKEGNSPTTKFGLELDTALLCHATEAEVQACLAELTAYMSVPQTCALTVVTLASNSLTYTTAAKVSAWARSHGIVVVATEALRCHERLPGLLAADYSFFPFKSLLHDVSDDGHDDTPLPADQDNLSPQLKGRLRAILRSTTELQGALDRAVHAEKQYLERLSESTKSKDLPQGVDVTAVCIAHIIIKNHDTFHFPEDWLYTVSNTIDPRFEEACSQLAKAGKQHAEWVSIYRPLMKYVVASFRQHLMMRSLFLTEEVWEILDRSKTTAAHSPTVAKRYLDVIASVVNPDIMLAAASEVGSDWDEQRTVMPAADASLMLSDIKKAVVGYIVKD